MKYLKLAWRHTNRHDPIELWSELDAERWEVRKIDVFVDGRMQIASSEFEEKGTWLGLIPAPELEELNGDNKLLAEYVDKIQFEELWAKAISIKQEKSKDNDRS